MHILCIIIRLRSILIFIYYLTLPRNILLYRKIVLDNNFRKKIYIIYRLRIVKTKSDK